MVCVCVCMCVCVCVCVCSGGGGGWWWWWGCMKFPSQKMIPRKKSLNVVYFYSINFVIKPVKQNSIQ